MLDNDFLAKCRSLDPSAEVDWEKNRIIIKTRLENDNMNKHRRLRRPIMAAAIIAAIFSLTVVAYAAVPAAWRLLDTQVTQGEEFLTDFWVDEFMLPDGTMSMGGNIVIDHEALEAAGGGVIIVDVEGEEWIVLDELHLDNKDDALALLQLENPLLPSFLPEGFAFERFTFPVNPNNHVYRMGSIRAAMHAVVYYTNGDNTIRLQISSLYPSLDGNSGVGLAAAEGQQALFINGNKALVTSGGLTNAEIARLDGVELYDSSTDWSNYHTSIMVSEAPDALAVDTAIHMIIDGVGYSIRGEGVSLYDLVRIAASMK